MNQVIACIDGTSHTKGVCDYAIWAAKRLDTALAFLHVLVRQADVKVDASGSIGLGAQESLLQELSDLDERRSMAAREHGSQLLEGARQYALQAGIRQVSVRQRHGDLTDTLLAQESDARLYVLGQHDDQAKPTRFLLDRNLESAVRTLHRPILVANRNYSEPRRFMIAFDGSETGEKMIETVAASPLLRGMECQVVTVGNTAQALQPAVGRLSDAGFKVTSQQLEGEAATVLPDYAHQRDMDMIVMGAYGHSRIRQLVVGSTTTAILRQSQVPVMVLR